MPSLENKVVTHITLYADASTQNRPPYIYAKQYDANSRYLVARIVDSDKNIVVTGAAQLNATKPDGTHSYIAGTVNADGTVTIGLTANLLAVEGKISCDITVFNSADESRVLLTTSTFFILVHESNYDSDAIESIDEFSTVSDALTKVAADLAAAETARDEAVAAAKEVQTALETKADGLALDDNKLQLVSGTTPLGSSIELPAVVSDLAVEDEKLYLLTDDGERIGNGASLPQQVDDLITGVEGDNTKLYLAKNGKPIGNGVVLPSGGSGSGGGKMVATDAEISGHISAASGTIGGWHIGVNDGYLRSATGIYGTYYWTTTGTNQLSATCYAFVALTPTGLVYVLKAGDDYDNSATIAIVDKINTSEGLPAPQDLSLTGAVVTFENVPDATYYEFFADNTSIGGIS